MPHQMGTVDAAVRMAARQAKGTESMNRISKMAMEPPRKSAEESATMQAR